MKIDKELITSKPACYIFDIDGCIANVDHLVKTNKQVYEIMLKEYNAKVKKYEEDYAEYRKKSSLNYVDKRLLVKPIHPESPVKPDVKNENKMNWDYFYNNVSKAEPIVGCLDVFIALAMTKKVILLTARDEHVRTQTVEWLKKVVMERAGQDAFRRINFTLIMKESKSSNKETIKYKKETIQNLIKQYNIQLIVEDHPEIVKEYTKLGLLVLQPNREWIKID